MLDLPLRVLVASRAYLVPSSHFPLFLLSFFNK